MLLNKKTNRNLILAGLTNLLESLKESNVTNSTSIQNTLLDFLINVTNNNPQIIDAFKPILPKLVEIYNALNTDQLTKLLNRTLGSFEIVTNIIANYNSSAMLDYLVQVIANGNQNLTNELLAHLYEYLPPLIAAIRQTNGSIEEVWPIVEPVIVSHLAVLLNDPSLANSSTPYVDAILDILKRIQAMNDSMLASHPEVTAILDKFETTLEQTKSLEAALDSVKGDINTLLYTSYMADPNVPNLLKSPILLDFISSYMQTMNITWAFESVHGQVSQLVTTEIKDELIPMLVNLILANRTENPEIRQIMTQFLVNLYDTQNATLALDSVKNETLNLLYSAFMADQSVPGILKNPKVQELIVEFFAIYEQTMNASIALASIKDETLALLYSDFMADPSVPDILKMPQVQALVAKFFAAYKETMNLTASFEAVKDDLVTLGISILLADQSQLPAFFKTPDVEALLTNFLTKYMESMDPMLAFDSIKNELVALVINRTMSDPSVPSILKKQAVTEIASVFLTSLLDTYNYTAAIESVKNETIDMLYAAFMSDPNVPTLLKNAQVQSVLCEFLITYMQTMNVEAAFDSVKNETLAYLYSAFMADPNVPGILKSPNVQAIVSQFLSVYSQTMNVIASFYSVETELVSLVYSFIGEAFI